MIKPLLFGSDYSVYVRIVRLALMEKGVDHELVPVDIFASEQPATCYRARHPFGKIPAFEHDGFRLYETGAITRYIDEAFAGPALQPADARSRARMNQVISIADNYVYPDLVWGLYVGLVEKTGRGEPCDNARVLKARERLTVCLDILGTFLASGSWLSGNALSLADIYIGPMFHYLMMVPDAEQAVCRRPHLHAWWERVSLRTSMTMTKPSA